MREMPDKRVWFVFGPVIAVAIPYFFWPSSRAEKFWELVLHGLLFVGPICLGVLSIREEYSLLNPSSTRDEWPVLFWLDVMFGCFVFGLIGGWKFLITLTEVL
jgi:hypothetical protein